MVSGRFSLPALIGQHRQRWEGCPHGGAGTLSGCPGQGHSCLSGAGQLLPAQQKPLYKHQALLPGGCRGHPVCPHMLELRQEGLETFLRAALCPRAVGAQRCQGACSMLQHPRLPGQELPVPAGRAGRTQTLTSAALLQERAVYYGRSRALLLQWTGRTHCADERSLSLAGCGRGMSQAAGPKPPAAEAQGGLLLACQSAKIM